MIGRTIAELRPGEWAESVHRVEMEEISGFIEAVGDYNPVHSDARFAASTQFREPIAPGIYTAGLISAVIGTKLPGPGVIYLSQSLKFLRPVKPGDTITARVEVMEVLPERNRARLSTVCRNQRGEEVLTGEAWVMPSRTRVVYDGANGQRPRSLATLAFRPWTWAAQTLALWSSLGRALLAPGARRQG